VDVLGHEDLCDDVECVGLAGGVDGIGEKFEGRSAFEEGLSFVAGKSEFVSVSGDVESLIFERGFSHERFYDHLQIRGRICRRHPR
jgi:hypothetical protein